MVLASTSVPTKAKTPGAKLRIITLKDRYAPIELGLTPSLIANSVNSSLCIIPRLRQARTFFNQISISPNSNSAEIKPSTEANAGEYFREKQYYIVLDVGLNKDIEESFSLKGEIKFKLKHN